MRRRMRPAGTPATACWLAVTAVLLMAGGRPADAAAARTVYVADGASGSPGTIWQASVNRSTGRPWPLSPSTVVTGEDPMHIAFTGDGRFAYATGAGEGLVYPYRVRPSSGRLSPLGAAIAAGVGAHGVAVSPDNGSAYVAAQEPGTVSQYSIDRKSGALTPKTPASLPSGAGASGVAITPDGRSVYVTNLDGGSISQYDVDPSTGVLTPKDPATVPAPPSPGGVGVSPDGRSLYVATLSGRLAQFTVGRGAGRLRPKHPATVRVGIGASGVAIRPDGRFVYVPNGGVDSVSQFSVGPSSGRLAALDPASVAAGDQPEGIAVTPDGRTIYVENAAAGTTSWFRSRARSGQLHAGGRPAESGPSPHGAAVSPNQGPRARFRVVRGDRVVRVGEPARFRAGASSDPDGSIARYSWRFGDGRVRADGSRAPRHRYRRPGHYRVRLVATDDEGCSRQLIYTGQTASCNGGRRAVAIRGVTVRGRR